MNIQHQSRTGDPLLDRVDGLIAFAVALREDIVREREAQQSNQQEMVEAARRVARSDDMSSREVAEFLGISGRSVEKGIAGTACLFRVRIKTGRRMRHLRLRVELHRRNLMDHGDCEDCDRVSLERLRLIR